MHGGEGGMGMEHDQSDEPSHTQRAVPLDDAQVETHNETFGRDVPAAKEAIPSNPYTVGQHTPRYY
jgi:hypothetical protein